MAPALIALLLISGGVSLASSTSMPGDTLYPVKVNFNENIRSSLSFSSESKAHWDAVLQSRRLEEAEYLMAEGKFDAEAEADLTARFNAYADDFDRHIDKMEENNDRDSVELMSDLEARLSAHEYILGSFQNANNNSNSNATSATDATADVSADGVIETNDNNSNAATTNSTVTVNGDFYSMVRSHRESVSREREILAMKFWADADASSKSSVELERTRAQRQIDEMNSSFNKINANADAMMTANLQSRMDRANEAYSRGSASFQAENYSEAYMNYNEARRIASEGNFVSQAGGRIGLSIFGNTTNNSNWDASESMVDGNGSLTTDGSVNSNSSDSNTNSGSTGSGASGNGEVDVNLGGGLNVDLGR